MKNEDTGNRTYAKKMLSSIRSQSPGIIPCTLCEKFMQAGEMYLLIYLINSLMAFRFGLPLMFMALGALLFTYAARKALESKSTVLEKTLEKEYLKNMAERMISTEEGCEERRKVAPLIKSFLTGAGPAVEHYRIFSSIAERTAKLVLAMITLALILTWRDTAKMLPFVLGAVFTALLTNELEARLDEKYRHRLPDKREDILTYAESGIKEEIRIRNRYTDLKCLIDVFKTVMALSFTLAYVFIFPPRESVMSLVLLYALYEFFLITISSGTNGRDRNLCAEDARLYFEFIGEKTGSK